jgi:hypothetical protein
MKEERTWVSPYNYCQNNPITITDPTGALDDDPPKGRDNTRMPAEEIPSIDRNNVNKPFVKNFSFNNLEKIKAEQEKQDLLQITGTILQKEPSVFEQIRMANDILPYLYKENTPDRIGAHVTSFIIDIALDVVDDATTTTTGLIHGPERSVNASGNINNRVEYEEGFMNTLINFAPTPNAKIPATKLNASEFSVIHKGTKVLSKPKSEVGIIIRKGNIATTEAIKAEKNASNTIKVFGNLGSVKKQIEDRK